MLRSVHGGCCTIVCCSPGAVQKHFLMALMHSCGCPQIAIRKMLQDDNSLTMMLFFGCVGLLNAACLAPVLIILRVGGFVQTAGLTLRIIGLTICKGALVACLIMLSLSTNNTAQLVACWILNTFFDHWGSKDYTTCGCRSI